ncbi:MAG: acetoacetate decarboxylase family protein [Leptolyngbyaceae cyanobacterium RU_5_1]|nr:acetoacetate decarboxylase family protein [Leptolyngbyaceae cyanobacterium RU_5_1]
MNSLSFPPDMKLVGSYSSYWVVWAKPLAEVQSLLPAGLELAPQTITPASTHPIMFAFGLQQNVHLNDFRFVFNLNYLEHVTSIPFVRPIGEQKQNFLYMPKLFLNEFLPVFGGDTIWGFHKELADVEFKDERFSVKTELSHKLQLSLTFKVTGDYASPATFPNFAAVEAMLTQPFVLDETLIMKLCLGCQIPYVAANFNWYLDEATLRPIQAELAIINAYVRGLQPGKYATPGIDQVPLGAFQLQNHWDLSMPFCC